MYIGIMSWNHLMLLTCRNLEVEILRGPSLGSAPSLDVVVRGSDHLHLDSRAERGWSRRENQNAASRKL